MPHIMKLHYEELLDEFELRGHATLHEGAIPDPYPDIDPKFNRNIRIDQQWWCHFYWKTTGALTHCMAGTWVLKTMLEQMGGKEFDLPGSEHEVEFECEPHKYKYDMRFNAGVVPEGVYRPVVTLTLKGPMGVYGPVAAFGEGPMVQFYKVG